MSAHRPTLRTPRSFRRNVRREAREFSNGLFEAHASLFAHIFAQHARESSVGARMRELFAEQALRRGASLSLQNETQGCTAASAMSGSLIAKTATVSSRAIFDEYVEQSIHGIDAARLRDSGEAMALQIDQLRTRHSRNLDGFRATHRLPFVIPGGETVRRVPF